MNKSVLIIFFLIITLFTLFLALFLNIPKKIVQTRWKKTYSGKYFFHSLLSIFVLLIVLFIITTLKIIFESVGSSDISDILENKIVKFVVDIFLPLIFFLATDYYIRTIRNKNSHLFSFLNLLFFIFFLLLVWFIWLGLFEIGLKKTPVRWFFSSNKIYFGGSCSCPNLPAKKVCLYHSKGDDIEKIKSKEQAANCSMFGCAWPTWYKYCD